MGRRAREVVLTGVDVALLATLDEEPNLVRACRRLGLTRDRGVYRLRRLGRAAGGSIVETDRGGSRGGHTRLTERGRRWLVQAREVVEVGRGPDRSGSILPASLLKGTYIGGGSPRIRLASGRVLYVGFSASAGRVISVAVDPEVVIVARRSFPTSARNVVPGTVRRLRPAGPHRVSLDVDIGGGSLLALVTPESVRELRLHAGARVFLYVKASALRPLGLGTKPSGPAPRAPARQRRDGQWLTVDSP